MDRIRNEIIIGTINVVKIPKKIQESKLQWPGYAGRKEAYVGRRVMKMDCGAGHQEADRGGDEWLV